MKKINLIEWLSRNSHEKQSPQRFARYAAMLIMLLALGVGQVWAAKGFKGPWNMQYNLGGDNIWLSDQSAGATYNLGTQATFILKGCWVQTYGNDNWTFSQVKWEYGYSGKSASGEYIMYESYGDPHKNADPGYWTYDDVLSFDVIEYAPNKVGQNTLWMRWILDGGYATSSTCYVNFTIPGFTTTSTSQAFDNTFIDGTNSKTISFGQHYGTALTTSNCAITGDDASDFSVTSISETGVTVQFYPRAAGSKSATLTITDAHSKTCTITLTGKTKYTVTYNKGDNGSGDNKTADKVYGTGLTLRGSGDFTRTGYHQTAWNTNSAGTGGTSYSLGGSYTTEAAVTLYPTWTANSYTIAFNANDANYIGAATGSTASVNATYDEDCTLTTNGFSRAGYTFAGWNSQADGKGTNYTNGQDDVRNLTSTNGGSVTLYAKWTPITYDIDLDDQGATSEYHKTSVTVTFGNAYINDLYPEPESTDLPWKTAYRFQGWYTGEGGTGLQIMDADGQLQSSKDGYTDSDGKWIRANGATLYAKWTQSSAYGYLDIYVNNNGGSGGGIVAIYNSSSLESFTASTRSGYNFQGFFTASEDGDQVIDEDGNIVAGNVTGFVTSGKWSNSVSSANIYAQWEPITYTVAFAKNDDPSYYSGTDTGTDPDNITATYNETFTFPANPYTRTNYHFIGWSKDKAQGADFPSDLEYDYEKAAGSTGSNYTTTQGATVIFYAKWRGNSHSVSFNPRGGSVLGSSSKTVNYGEAYGTLPTAYKSGGYEFAGWYTEPDGAGSEVTAETIVSATSDHTVYAHYTKVDRVYFKNTIGWDEVYVTYDAYWNTYGHGGGTNDCGTGNYDRVYHKMTRVGGTDVWYDDIPSTYLGSRSAWKFFIAFNDQELLTGDKHVPTTGNYENFNKGEAVFRKDFDSIATMFVPKNTDEMGGDGKGIDGNYPKNGVKYISTGYHKNNGAGDEDPGYTSGYWRTYNDIFSGYELTYSVHAAESWTSKKLYAPTPSDSVFSYTLTLPANSQYDFAIYKKYGPNGKSDQWRIDDTMITSSNCTNRKLICEPRNSWFETTVAGDYTIKITMKSDGHMYLTIEYPFAVGDYKVVYSYTKGSAQTFESEYIKARANGVDTISMFIHSEDSVTASSRSLSLHKCTAISAAGVPTWNTTSSIDLPEETASSDGDEVTSGVYNFVITQNEGGTSATGAPAGKYEGDYYIRTACADGGWDFYKYRGDNVMTLSEYSLKQTIAAPFSHYFCKYIGGDEIPITTDITYTVATKYSPKICPIMVGDATIGDVGNKVLPTGNPANIRFSWNEQTNVTRRAYLKSAQGAGNTRYLVMHGADNKLRNSAGNEIAADAGASLAANELLFTDKGNWIYELEIKALPGAKVSILAQYNSVDRPLVGNADASQGETLISGSSATAYPMRAVYDFKTNRLMTAWTPSGTITDALSNVDVLIERHNQDGATTITFGKASAEAAAGSISAKRVIGALRFDYTELVGNVTFWTSETRGKMMFFVSFPFDVNVSDIFGLNSAYGEAYIVQKYNGALRAEKGFFLGDGTTSFWEILPVDSVMHAGVGYVVTMDNDYLNNDKGHVWDNKSAGDHVYLYFPSATPVTINSDAKTITVPAHECKINRTFGKLNHKYTDSNWNLMGVPIFQNHTGNATEGTPGAIFTASEEPSDTTDYKEHPDLGYFYQWGTDKNYTIRSAVGFTFLPMHSYMVQYAGDVKFTCAEPSVVPASVAPRRTPMTENYNIELQVLNSNNDMLNHTYVELRENAVDTFAVNEDTYMMSNSKAVNVYTFAGAYDVAANVLSIDSHIVPVGVIVNQAGTYTFSMPSNFSGNVTLVDNVTGIHTNLALSDYTVDLTTGTNDNRFYLEIDINKTPTSIDVIEEGGSLKDGKAHKFIENGLMYIIKDGVLYDARGNRVK